MFDGQSAKEPQGHNARFTLVEVSKPLERGIEIEQLLTIEGLKGNFSSDAGQSHGPPPATALLGPPFAGVVDQQAAHDVGSYSKEVSLPLPVSASLVHQLEIGLVDQGRGLKGVAGSLSIQIPLGKAAQLVVDHREQVLRRSRTCLSKSGQNLIHPVFGVVNHCFFPTVTSHVWHDDSNQVRVEPSLVVRS